MVVLNKIYTRTGDAGETSLGDGTRMPKHSVRVACYGVVDELNATVGLARTHADCGTDDRLSAIQNDLFDLGADLCRPEEDLCRPEEKGEDVRAERPPLRVAESQVSRLEREIDAMNEALEPLRSFVLPGGSSLSAHLHHCRTVARRAERSATELAIAEEVNPEAVRYLNRLSDWFFVAARVANDDGRSDVLWVPGANR